jgi:CSLREA domain-containing protein
MRLLLAGLLTLILAGPASAADITVTTRLDTVADDGRCSLREAVTAANTNAATGGCPAGTLAMDVLVLGEGHYLLSRAGAREDGNATGDLDLFDGGPVTLRGIGRDRTVVSAEGLDRVLDVLIDDVTIADLAITGGAAPDGTDGAPGTNPGQPGHSGGGVRSLGRLEIRDAAVRGNRAGSGGAGGNGTGSVLGGSGGRGGEGGGIHSTATLTLTRTRVMHNRAGDSGRAGNGAIVGAAAEQPGGDGGGIAAFGITTVAGSVIEGNRAGAGGDGGDAGTAGGNGAVGGDGGGILVIAPAEIVNSTIAGNAAGPGGRGGSAVSNGGNGGRGGHGAGVYATGQVAVRGVLFSGNTTGEGGGGGNGAALGGNAGDGGAGGNGAGLMGFTGADVEVESSTFAGGVTGAGGPSGLGPLANAGPAGSGSAAYGVGIVSLARTIVSGTCAGAIDDGGGNLGTDFSCPVTVASLLLDANGMPGPGSHAIDASTSCPSTDLAGTARPQGVGCDVGALEVPAAPLAVARTGVEFGSVTAGGTATRSVDVSNPGLPALPLAISVSGDPAFTLDGHTCGAALAGGSDCSVTVRFAPTATGARTGTLQIGNEVVNLGGTGVAPPTDPPGGGAPQVPQETARCLVPRLKGKTLVAAARALQNANCKLGKVTRRGRGRPGRVRSFSRKAGTSLPAGTAVRLVLNRRR